MDNGLFLLLILWYIKNVKIKTKFLLLLMNASRVFGAFAWIVLAGVGIFSYTGHVQAQEKLAPETVVGADYATDSLEILAPYTAGDENSGSLVFSLLLKNTSPDQQKYRLGVDFRNTSAKGSDRLYIARTPELYTIAGDTEERVEFTVPSPKFLSGVYTVSVGASDEKGNLISMVNLDDMKFSGIEAVSLSDCTFSGQSLSDDIKVKESAPAEVSVACQATWSGEEASMTTVSVRLTDSRYAPAFEVGRTEVSLSKQAASVTVPLSQALPAGFYQLEITPLDSDDRPVGVSVRTPIAIEGVGGKIVAIADTEVEQKDGKSVVPVSVLTETYDDSTYQVALSLTSEGKACAGSLKLPLDVKKNESTGAFTIDKECRYPVIMVTLSDASGKKLDQAVRAFGERVPVRAAAVTPTLNEMTSTPMMSWGLILLFSLPVLIVIGYLARKRMNTTRMMPLFFIFAVSVLFAGWTGEAQAAAKGYYLNYYCFPDDPCPEATTIMVNYNVKDTFSPGEDIIIGQTIGSDDYPITPVTGGALFGINGSNYTGNLDGKSYRAQELREGVFNSYSDVKLKAPMTPGTFTLSLGVTMSGYTNPRAESVTLRVVGKPTCVAPGWGDAEAVYDGWAGSAPGWCSKYPNGVCTSGKGGNSASSQGSVTSCCDKDMSVDNVAYVRYCQGGKGGGNVDVTMTGKAKQVGFWKQFTNSAEASGPAVNISAGQTALLTWTSVGATSCTLTVPPAAGRPVSTNVTDSPISGLTTGTHIITIDCTNGTNSDSDRVTVNVNSAPNVPTITGPATGVTGTNYSYVMTSTDPDGDTLRYGFDGDGNNSVDRFYPSTGYVASGTGQTAIKSWSTPGTYIIQASAQDSKGAGSNFTAKTITITNPVAAALNVCPTSATVGDKGGTASLKAWHTTTGVTFNGCAAPNGTDRTSSANWSSSNSGIASVDNGSSKGRVTGVTPGGPVTIQATYSSLSDSSAITVICTKVTCSNYTDEAQLVCTTDQFHPSDSCGGTLNCPGARTCDYNWKEVAP